MSGGTHASDEANRAAENIRAGLRSRAEAARSEARDQGLDRRRFGGEENAPVRKRKTSLTHIMSTLRQSQFSDRDALSDLKHCFAASEEGDAPDDFFASDPSASGLHSLVAVLTGSEPALQLLAAQAIANLAPLKERNGLSLARAAGPYLITMLSSGCRQLQEASGVALGNLALAGTKVVRVLLNQEVLESLISVLDDEAEAVQASGFYALYHILHSLGGNLSDSKAVWETLCARCVADIGSKAPIELYWVLFVLSCCPESHATLVSEASITKALDVCTYEIFQKSDSRPLVKIVTPLVRFLANVSAGPQGESAVLFTVRHPDLPAILMALLGTNYTHLCKETLWWFSNVTNSESVLVQEELIELDLMDKMEYHTVQAVQKVDPYLTNVIG